MADRYFLSQPTAPQETVWIDGDVAHHLINVMRHRVGDAVMLFDGQGQEYCGIVAAIEKRRLQVKIESNRSVERETAVDVHVWSALPRGDRQRFLIEKLVEVGAHTFRPLVTQHSVVRPGDRQQAKFEKWVIEATQQCGRGHLMAIEPAIRFGEAVEQTVPGLRLMGDPGGKPLRDLLGPGVLTQRPQGAAASLDDTVSDRPMAVVLIGPEGGWSDGERELAQRAGWQLASWGHTTMRIETAAMVAAALLVEFGASISATR